MLTEGSPTGLRLANITTSGVLSGNTSLIYAIKNPLIFVYNTVASFGDWYTNNTIYQDNTLWGDGTDKSAFDPCPSGWRVAPNGTWSDFTRTEDVLQPMNGNFPFYIKGIANEQGAVGDYHQTNGRLYKVSASDEGTPLAWYPATGTRRAYTGVLQGTGDYGYSNSCESSSTKCSFLCFATYRVIVSDSNSRAYGYSVRCVQE